MKAAIYSPYLDTFGGGERYIATIGEILSRHNFEADILLDNNLINLGAENLKNQLSKRFNLNLEKVSFIKAPIGKGSNFFSRFFFLKKYKILFYLTDGSIFYPTAKKNILHIQSPLVGQPTTSFWGLVKLRRWDLIIYNSEFTKKFSEKNWPSQSQVIYPPVDTENIKPLKKRKYILSVGRFFGYLKDKKQEILINVFKNLCSSKKPNGWSLHLAGSASDGDKSYLDSLKVKANGFPIKFYPNLNYSDLIRLYGESSIYWHAAGFGEDDPIKMEHFGISTVEAMAAGCVPVVINKGGQTEIIENRENGFLWNSLEELEEFTITLVKDRNLRNKLSKNAISKSQFFSKIKFEKEIMELIKK